MLEADWCVIRGTGGLTNCLRISSRFVMNLRVRSVHVLSDIVGAWYQGRGRASSIPVLAPPQSPEKYGKGLRGTAFSDPFCVAITGVGTLIITNTHTHYEL